jgi:hypothetical protein
VRRNGDEDGTIDEMDGMSIAGVAGGDEGAAGTDGAAGMPTEWTSVRARWSRACRRS